MENGHDVDGLVLDFINQPVWLLEQFAILRPELGERLAAVGVLLESLGGLLERLLEAGCVVRLVLVEQIKADLFDLLDRAI